LSGLVRARELHQSRRDIAAFNHVCVDAEIARESQMFFHSVSLIL